MYRHLASSILPSWIHREARVCDGNGGQESRHGNGEWRMVSLWALNSCTFRGIHTLHSSILIPQPLSKDGQLLLKELSWTSAIKVLDFARTQCIVIWPTTIKSV